MLHLQWIVCCLLFCTACTALKQYVLCSIAMQCLRPNAWPSIWNANYCNTETIMQCKIMHKILQCKMLQWTVWGPMSSQPSARRLELFWHGFAISNMSILVFTILIIIIVVVKKNTFVSFINEQRKTNLDWVHCSAVSSSSISPLSSQWSSADHLYALLLHIWAKRFCHFWYEHHCLHFPYHHRQCHHHHFYTII